MLKQRAHPNPHALKTQALCSTFEKACGSPGFIFVVDGETGEEGHESMKQQRKAERRSHAITGLRC